MNDKVQALLFLATEAIEKIKGKTTDESGIRTHALSDQISSIT